MKKISDFFDRFKNITPPHGALKKAIVSALCDCAGIIVDTGAVSVERGIAFVKASSVAKNTIRLNRGKILEQVFSELPKAREMLRDIR